MNRYTIFIAVLAASLLLFPVAGTTVAAPEAHGAGAAEAHDDGHGDMSLNPLVPFQMETAVWTLVIFLLILLILGKFAFGPIAGALDARERSVADHIASAAQANEEAKGILAQYHQKLDDSRDEVRRILETAKQDAQRAGDAIVEKAKAAAELEHQRALKDIDAATSGALRSIAEKSATLATELAGKMIRKEVTPEAHRDLIRGALDEFAKN